MNANDTQPTATATAPQGVKAHRLIKLGVDVHWRQSVVVRQIDGMSPQPPQCFAPDAFVAWAKKQVELADEVHCCYEAGPFGFVLHKRLVALGVKNLVMRPRNWDEYGKKVKTDRRDALALVSCLDRYLAGNKEALNVVRVPTDEEERARSDSRQRAQLLAERKRPTRKPTPISSLLERVGARSDPWALKPDPKCGRQLVPLYDSHLS